MSNFAFKIRAYQGVKTAEMIDLGGKPQLCEIEPRPVFVVTAEGPEGPEEVVATFPSLEAAQEAAEALDKQMRAELGNEGNGPRLASRDGRTLQ